MVGAGDMDYLHYLLICILGFNQSAVLPLVEVMHVMRTSSTVNYIPAHIFVEDGMTAME